MGKATRLLAAFGLVLTGSLAIGAGGGVALEPAGNDPGDVLSLQRGARNFMNYCAGCHSAKYVRFNSIAEDLELTEDQIVENLMFNATATFETIQASMSAEDSARWFGQPPPDMSLLARAKTTDHIYNFLRGFYVDPDSPTGVDNTILPGTSMPHVLWELQGFQSAVFMTDEHGIEVFDSFETVTEGSMSAAEYDAFVRDTVNFLEYVSEPVRATRQRLGIWVIGFLALFWVLAQSLKKQVWSDVS